MDPDETPYFKGDKFKSLLFAKFRNTEVATEAIDMVNKSNLKHGEGDIRCKPDAPVEVRAIRSLLLGLHWRLNEWGSISKKAIRVDIPTGTMTVGGKPVMAVCVYEGKLKITWMDSTWEAWTELHQSTEMIEMIESGNKKLEQSALQKSAELGKGKGKNKNARNPCTARGKRNGQDDEAIVAAPCGVKTRSLEGAFLGGVKTWSFGLVSCSMSGSECRRVLGGPGHSAPSCRSGQATDVDASGIEGAVWTLTDGRSLQPTLGDHAVPHGEKTRPNSYMHEDLGGTKTASTGGVRDMYAFVDGERPIVLSTSQNDCA